MKAAEHGIWVLQNATPTGPGFRFLTGHTGTAALGPYRWDTLNG